MNPRPPTPYLIFYDGDCIVCRREIAHYRRLETGDQLLYIDIASADFVAGDHGRAHSDFMGQMHLRDADGLWHLGVDAFTLIWQLLPGWHWHLGARILRLPLIRDLAWWAYRLFARHRHLLPRRNCASDSCRR
jgi:predicted DCC family thiol-disulfide oxidoreductase YuxK